MKKYEELIIFVKFRFIMNGFYYENLFYLLQIGYYSTQNGLKVLQESIHREREGLPIPDRNRKLIVVSIKVNIIFR